MCSVPQLDGAALCVWVQVKQLSLSPVLRETPLSLGVGSASCRAPTWGTGCGAEGQVLLSTA